MREETSKGILGLRHKHEMNFEFSPGISQEGAQAIFSTDLYLEQTGHDFGQSNGNIYIFLVSYTSAKV